MLPAPPDRSVMRQVTERLWQTSHPVPSSSFLLCGEFPQLPIKAQNNRSIRLSRKEKAGGPAGELRNRVFWHSSPLPSDWSINRYIAAAWKKDSQQRLGELQLPSCSAPLHAPPRSLGAPCALAALAQPWHP